MTGRRVGQWDLAALALLALGLLLAPCVLLHETGFVLGYSAVSTRQAPVDVVASAATLLGRALFEAMGLATYVFLGAWFTLVIVLFRRAHLLAWTSRLAGWLLLLPCVAVVSDRLAWTGTATSVAGPGGSL